MAKAPAFQFYPGDWLRDPVAGCSLAAQGLWLRMMLVAHDCEKYGVLAANGLPLEPGAIARRCGCSLKEYEKHLKELFGAGVPSRNEQGAILSRRMVRDAEIREKRAAGGASGGEHGHKGGRPDRPENNPLPNDGRGGLRGTERGYDGNPPSSSASTSPFGEKKETADAAPEKPPKARSSRKEPTGPHADAIRAFTDRWNAKYAPQTFPFVGGRDGGAVKAMLESLGGNVERFAAAVDRYLADPDPFYAGHGLKLMQTRLERWLVPATNKRPTGGMFPSKAERSDGEFEDYVVDAFPEGTR